MGLFASGVTIVTFWDMEDRPCGMTASSFSSVSIDPLLILVCVNRAARTYEDVAERARFGVNILSQSGAHISSHCARPGADKILDRSWLDRGSYHKADGLESPPVIEGALAHLDCTVYSEIEAGTHSIFVGRVEGVGMSQTASEEPLLYYRGKYRELTRSGALTG